MAAQDAVANLRRDAMAVGMAIDAQRVARAACDAMHRAAGGPEVRTGVFVGTHGLLLAQAVRALTADGAVTADDAIKAITESARASLALNLTPWSLGEPR